MLPKIDVDLRQDFTLQTRQTSNTYRLDSGRARVYGKADGIRAVEQAVYKILNTERYQYPIYSWNYGVELAELFGQPASYAIPEIKRRIVEALTQDDRITGVDAFSFETGKGKVFAPFTVHTVFGDVEAGKEVEV